VRDLKRDFRTTNVVHNIKRR